MLTNRPCLVILKNIYFVCDKLMDSREQSLLNVPPHLFPSHDDHQLCGQLNQTATRITLGQGESLFYMKPSVFPTRRERACEKMIRNEWDKSPLRSSVWLNSQTCRSTSRDSPQTSLWRRPHRSRTSSSWQTGTETSLSSAGSHIPGEFWGFL